jgi:hypothetical protein
MLQVIESVVFGFALMMVMVVGLLTAVLFLLTMVSWVADGAARIFFARGHDRPPTG